MCPLARAHQTVDKPNGMIAAFGGFVGNGLDRSVPPCQKYDAT